MEARVTSSSKMKVLGVGIVCFDVVHTCASYPKEDEKVRALSEQFRRGGNASTFATVVSLLGEHSVEFLSTVSSGYETEFCLSEMKSCGVGVQYCVEHCSHHLPTSYVIISKETNSRTIVHHRDIPELTYEDFQNVPWRQFNWIHFEGRNLSAVQRVIEDIASFNKTASADQRIRVSVELEKPFVRDAPHKIHLQADLVLIGKDYAMSSGYHSATEAVLGVAMETKKGAAITCTWGDQGAAGLDNGGHVFLVPAHPPAEVVSTLGAGDTFNAGVVNKLLSGSSLKDAVTFACKLAGLKCGTTDYKDLKKAISET